MEIMLSKYLVVWFAITVDFKRNAIKGRYGKWMHMVNVIDQFSLEIIYKFLLFSIETHESFFGTNMQKEVHDEAPFNLAVNSYPIVQMNSSHSHILYQSERTMWVWVCMLSLTFQLPREMASAESSPLLMPFDHVKAAVTEFGMIFIFRNQLWISRNKIMYWIVFLGFRMQN